MQGDPDAHRMNMTEFMEKIPELKQDYANRGKLSYEDVPIREILIDDKENGLINQARQYPMKFIQASYMSKIELVLPGSPEYGNEEPILLITLEEKLPVGFASELTALVNSRNSYNDGTGVTPEEYSVLPGNGTAEHDANLDLKLQDEKRQKMGAPRQCSLHRQEV